MFCSKCGAEIKENALFCSKCGNRVKEKEQMENVGERKLYMTNIDWKKTTMCASIVGIISLFLPFVQDTWDEEFHNIYGIIAETGSFGEFLVAILWYNIPMFWTLFFQKINCYKVSIVGGVFMLINAATANLLADHVTSGGIGFVLFCISTAVCIIGPFLQKKSK